MGILNNGDWLRSTLATQLGTLQNSGIPTGDAWKNYLDILNKIAPALDQNIGNGTSTVWGQNGMYDLNNNLAAYQQGLPALLQQLTGNGQHATNAQNTNQALLDSIFGNTNQVNSAFSMFNNGSGQGQDLFNAGLSQFNSPYNQTMGDVGNYLTSTLGANPYNQSQQDMGNYGIQHGGWTNQLGATNDAAMGLVNHQGVTDALGQGMGMGQGLTGQGMDLLHAGQNYSNPALNAGTGFALNTMANHGATPDNTAINNYIKGQLSQGNGNMQSGLDFANLLMNGGGVSDLTKQGGQIALNYANGGGPSIYSEMPSWLQDINTNISVGGGYGGGGGGSISMPKVDSGYTDSLNGVLDKAKAILAENPLLGMNQAINMARDQAATSTAQQYKAVMGRALARGGGPGATVANGLQNQGMAEYADAGSQAEAGAMRDAAKTQQGLQLQKYGIGADLAKAMEQVAAQRNATSSSLAGQVAGANASLAAAGMNASNQQAQLQASINAQMAQAKMGLYGNLAGLNLQKMLGGLSGVENFSNQENQMSLAGLNALPQLQNVLNTKEGNLLSAYNNSTGQQNDLTKAAMTNLGNYQDIIGKNQLGQMGIGNDLIKTGTGLYDSQAKQASANLLGGLNASNQANSTAGQNLSTYAGIAKNAGDNQLSWAKLGGDLSQNNVNNNLNLLKTLDSVNNTNNNYQVNMGKVANDLWNTQNNGLMGAFKNSLDLGNQGINQFSALTGAQNGAFNSQTNNLGNIAQLIANSQNTYAGLATNAMNPLTAAIQGYAGINPSAGGQAGWLGGVLNSAAQGAGAAAVGASDIRLKKDIKSLEHGLEEIEKLESVSWKWKDYNDSSTGVIAQDLEKVLPHLVSEGSDGYKRVNYMELIPVLINAVKELSQKVKELQK